MSRGQAIVDTAVSKDASDRIWDAFRRWGYLQANIDPLGDLAPVPMPELDVQVRTPRRRGGITAEASASSSCTSRTANGGNGFRSAWKPTRRQRIRNASLNAYAWRSFRAGPPDAISRHEALFPRRRSIAASASGFHSERSVRTRSGAGRAGDEPPRTLERDGAHRRTRSGGSVRAIRGCGSAQRAGRRRREVPHGRHRRFRGGEWKDDRDSSGFESEPPGGSGSCGVGRARAKQTRIGLGTGGRRSCR